MTNKPCASNIEKVVGENNVIAARLHLAEMEIASLKMVNAKLGNQLSVVTKKLADAKNEVARMDMVMKHRVHNMGAPRRYSYEIEFGRQTASHRQLQG